MKALEHGKGIRTECINDDDAWNFSVWDWQEPADTSWPAGYVRNFQKNPTVVVM